MRGPKEPQKASSALAALELDQCLAKTRKGSVGESLPGVDILTHCLIVGEVAKELLARQPGWLREALFPVGSELVAAVHDVGKVSPTFQKRLANALGRTLTGFDDVNPDLEKNWMGHPGVSQAAAQGSGTFIPEILGRHHGSSPALGLYDAKCEVFGGEEWQKRREELINTLKGRLNTNWPLVRDEIHASVLSGLTTVSDWIGSGPLFEQPGDSWKPLVVKALYRAGFVKPRVRRGLSFQDIFLFDPRPVQSLLADACRLPGVYILEAPMGLGKTEAALYAAYLALESDRATGIYFALPTQLTSNRIFERMNLFLDRILEADQPHRQSLLIHGSAKLLEDLELGEDGSPGGSWFKSTKRELLAPFAVGTIDQALMAVMNVRHGFVRTFGLTGKVVILDEVHSYDSYTGTLLDNLVKALIEVHCTVIILSATLTRERRSLLLDGETSHEERYPLVAARPREGVMRMLAAEPQADVEVALRFAADDGLAMDEALGRAEDGQQVLWVENTVAEAQERYKTLASRANDCGADCGLLHSRFIKADRQRNERHWIDLYGPSGKALRALGGRILIGTQVVEQSLDIDADFLITRLCPTDMLLQRMGRLWRHENPRPVKARNEAWILTLPWEETVANPETALGKSMFVYSPYVLCRTLEAWENMKSVSIPRQIRSLLEITYEERDETGVLARFKHDLEARRQKLRGLALVGLSRGGVTLPERVATRYSEMDTVEVLLLKYYRKQGADTVVTFTDNEV
ncbi:MAG TPA: CRISPR-associated helicase Cas3', partial [Magnetospirillaceae bacterium]|nr:CRISPR-associated helicase Cas3' [Magnetospirillaceae bacterium]